MPGICVAVKATTSVSGSLRKTTLKLWKSRPPAPMMMTRFMTSPLNPRRAMRFLCVLAFKSNIRAPGDASARNRIRGAGDYRRGLRAPPAADFERADQIGDRKEADEPVSLDDEAAVQVSLGQ